MIVAAQNDDIGGIRASDAKGVSEKTKTKALELAIYDGKWLAACYLLDLGAEVNGWCLLACGWRRSDPESKNFALEMLRKGVSTKAIDHYCNIFCDGDRPDEWLGLSPSKSQVAKRGYDGHI
jgi:hypothetical protein